MEEKCFYDPETEGTYQCPKCKHWYCDECYEMFLPIDDSNWSKTNLMCPQCHSERYELSKFERAQDA